MKLRRLAIDRLPGIDRRFELDDLGDGLNILVGPNGIGKSRLSAAVRSLLWPDRGIKDGGLIADATFDHDGAAWRVSRDGSAHSWQRDGIDTEAPTLPGERLDGCFFLDLRDLLDDTDGAGEDLADRIRRQMSGGFDLDAVRDRFEDSVPKRPGSKEGKALSAADKEIRKAEREQERIAREEEKLEALEAEASAAETASRRQRHYETALSVLGLRTELEVARAELADLPATLANLDGRELARIDTLDQELGNRRRDRGDTHQALAASRSDAEASGLTEAIEAAALDTWRQRADKLQELEHLKEAADVDATAARQAAAASRVPLGARSQPISGSNREPAPSTQTGAEVTPVPALEDDADLFVFLRESQQLATERIALDERLKLLSARDFSEDQERRLELARRGIGPLRAWLRAPDTDRPGSATALWPPKKALLSLGAVLVAVGSGLLFKPEYLPWALGVGGVGIGLLAAGLLSRLRIIRDRATDWRSVARQQFPEVLGSPDVWSTDTVETLLHELEDEVAKLDADKMRARDRAVESGGLRENLNSLEERTAALELKRAELAERLSLEELRPDAELVDMARALDAARNAQVGASKAAEKLGKLEETYRQGINAVSAYLEAQGEGSATDAASARAGVQALEARDRALRKANDDEDRERKALDRIDREIEKLEADRSAIYRGAGITGEIDADSRAELTRLLGGLKRYGELTTQRSDLGSRIARGQSDLDAAQEGALMELDVDELKRQEASLAKASRNRAERDREIGEIRERARSAREGHALEEAIAERSAVLKELRDRRDEALAAAAGSFLVEGVRREHETHQMPRVLERARDRFSTFTHARYRLTVSTAGGGSFVAIDSNSDIGLTLDKLSDGTRAQLILAARLAFAEEVEQGADLPLFLDEALDHSDPERFHSIAGSLARMVADEGRQIFYLSNDPTDVDRFRSAFDSEDCDRLKAIDFGEIRGQAARVDGPDSLRVSPLAAVPSPMGPDAESYGAALGVPPLDAGQNPLSQHLYYVLRDDLTLLHELLEARIETVGQCDNLLRGNSEFARTILAGGAAAGESGSQLTARIELLVTFFHARQEGRGKSVGRLEIEASGAVTPTFLDAVVEVAADLDGDPQRLLAALRERKDSRLSGFRTKATDDLGRFFGEQGYTDERPILDESAIVERVMGTPAAHRLSPKAAAEFVHVWWSLCEAATTAGHLA